MGVSALVVKAVALYAAGFLGETLIPAVMPVYARADIQFERGEGAWLIATNGDDGYDFDHADWANARLAKPSVSSPDEAPGETETPDVPTTDDSKTVYLSDLKWSSVSNGWGKVEIAPSVTPVVAPSVTQSGAWTSTVVKSR